MKNFVRRCVLVLSPGRSGTSATTRVLNFLGCELPKTLVHPDKSNSKGYFESSILYGLNSKLIDKYLGHHNPSEPKLLNIKDIPKSEVECDVGKISQIITDEYKNTKLFVLKCASIIKIFPLYLQVLQKLKVTPLVVHPVRHPVNVSVSRLLRAKGKQLSDMGGGASF